MTEIRSKGIRPGRVSASNRSMPRCRKLASHQGVSSENFRNPLIAIEFSKSVQIGVLICTLAVDGSARPRTIRGVC